MADEETVMVKVTKPFTFTHADGRVEQVKAGDYTGPEDSVKHPFFAAHTEAPPPDAAPPGSDQFIQRERERMIAKREKEAAEMPPPPNSAEANEAAVQKAIAERSKVIMEQMQREDAQRKAEAEARMDQLTRTHLEANQRAEAAEARAAELEKQLAAAKEQHASVVQQLDEATAPVVEPVDAKGKGK